MRPLTPALIALSLLSCHDSSTAPSLTPPDRDTDALFQTDSLSYTLVDDGLWDANITIQFTNKTATPTYFANCNGYSALRLEKLVAGLWKEAWLAIIPACSSLPAAVAPNAVYNPRILFSAGRAGSNVVPKFEVDPIDGLYRIVWTDSPLTVRDDTAPAELLPLDQRVSNRFLLKTVRN